MKSVCPKAENGLVAILKSPPFEVARSQNRFSGYGLQVGEVGTWDKFRLGNRLPGICLNFIYSPFFICALYNVIIQSSVKE